MAEIDMKVINTKSRAETTVVLTLGNDIKEKFNSSIENKTNKFYIRYRKEADNSGDWNDKRITKDDRVNLEKFRIKNFAKAEERDFYVIQLVYNSDEGDEVIAESVSFIGVPYNVRILVRRGMVEKLGNGYKIIINSECPFGRDNIYYTFKGREDIKYIMPIDIPAEEDTVFFVKGSEEPKVEVAASKKSYINLEIN